jgi:dUTP pyrophosphatase
MKILLDEGAFPPVRAHATDAGLDLRAKEDVLIRAGCSAAVGTGVHAELPHDTAGILISKSGLNIKNDITSTGLIDEGYTGEIIVKLYNHGNKDYMVRAGDKITQLVIVPVLFERIETVGSFTANTERGDAGFGSSGR